MRPALRAALGRGREAIAGALVAGLAAWVALGTYGITRGVALALGALGLGLVWTGLQRWRFAEGDRGPGVVEIDERRLTYWGPEAGGVVDLDDLARLEFRPEAGGAWVLSGPGGPLVVPVGAEGAEALLDLFAALPGLSAEALVAARRSTARVVLWTRPNVLPFPGRPGRRVS